jgi:RNA polymerase sigma factor (sigma-70 family)
MIAAHEQALRRTARRYSIDAEDAEDAYQRALEIALTKAPTTDPHELIRWTQTVTKHEALAVRQGREKLLGHGGDSVGDPVALIPAGEDGPGEQVERREVIARSREALMALKPAELRAMSLLAEGYSYAEIGAMTGFSRTKVNRVLAEGRDRFRSLISSSEDGSRCRQLRPLLSAFCDGEAGPRDSTVVREHLRACARCRATMRAYRAAPGIAAALSPVLPQSRSLLERAQELASGLGSRLPGLGGDDATATQIAAAGGSRGAGLAAVAKLLSLCAGAAGTAACVATGVLPAPLGLSPEHGRRAAIERSAARPAEPPASEAVQYEPAEPAPAPQPKAPSKEETREADAEPSEAPTGAVEYEPPPAPAPAPAPSGNAESSAPSPSSGTAAGEFGP